MSGTMSHADQRSPPPVGPPSVHPHHDHPAHHHPPPRGSSGGDHSAHAHMVDDFRRRFWVSLALTLPVLATSEMVRHLLGLRGRLVFPGEGYVGFAFASAVYLYGGWPFLTGFVDELRKRLPGMMTLVALAITVAYAYSALVVLGLPGNVFFWETATLIDIMLLGHWIEMRSVLGASRALEQLVRLLPAGAHRLRADGAVEEVPLDALTPGDRVLVKPGEKIPTDGLVVQGRTSVNQAMLTGESQPVEKGEGDEVIGGAVNGEGAITIQIRRTGADTYLSQVIELVRKAQETRSRTQDLANRLIELIDREAAHARAGRAAWIRAKLNGLADPEVITALYRASQAGVDVGLVVRGVCTLRPGVVGLSERIRVVSVLGRFLEHARIYAFANGDAAEYYIGSADWRPRNLRHRVEVVTPVRDTAARARLDAILGAELEDPTAWDLDPDGVYHRRVPSPGGDGRSSQERLLGPAGATA